MSPPNRLILSSLCLALVASCATPREKLADHPQANANRAWITRHDLKPDFAREKTYIEQRRAQVGVRRSSPVTALCFCGGGLRSGTISLGVLQGLEETDLLRRADYLSTVSGGSYTGAWFASHLLPQASASVRNEKALLYKQYADYQADRTALLQTEPVGDGDYSPSRRTGPVDRLTDRRGFFFGKSNWRGFTEFPVHYAWRLPLNAFFDLALHLKPVRGKGNWYHTSHYYKGAIQRTYLSPPKTPIAGQETDPTGFFKGRPHRLSLSEMNPPGGQAPYLVINGALINRRPEVKAVGEVLPFEFSRYAVGAPQLGYVPASDFGFPSLGELPADGQHRRTVHRTNSLASLPFLQTKPISLADAVAASGAAVDAAAFAAKGDPVAPAFTDPAKREIPVVRSAWLNWDTTLKLFNANLRYHNRNFAMQIGDEPKYPWSLADDLRDRLRETTTDRFNPTMRSNSLYVSDGAHYDNLAVFAMLERPEVEEIWSFDTGCDGSYKFNDLNRLRQLAKAAGWSQLDAWENGRRIFVDRGNESKVALDELLDDGATATEARVWQRDESPVFHTKLRRGGRTVSLWYVKVSYRDGDGIPAGKNQRTLSRVGAAKGKPTRDFLAEYKRGLHGNRTTASRFPHTSTANLSYTQNDFDAYREMGRVLAHTLAVERKK